ncbi:EamA family transporter [Deinococcus sp. HMF7604]|uniref:EamA family transporter n=1 Tax=Deinococcus betulae TaxID=2873312 RepID=UPI001CCE987D|nr:EamA family transporter [Deinococcus betulae]MBZ9752853.1 EamA family transporter [Deinococcus betulae]
MLQATRPPLPPMPALLLAVLSVQGGAAFAKGLFAQLGPVGATGLRIGLAAVFLALIFRPRWLALTTAQWRVLLSYGLVLGAMNLLYYLSLARIPLGLAVTLEFVGPLVLATVTSRQKLDLLWVALAASGIVLITPWSGESLDTLGMVLALLAGACWAVYVVLGGRVSQVLPTSVGVAAGMLVAALAVLPVVLLTHAWTGLTPQLLGAGALLAILSSAVPFTLELVALRALPARTFSVLLSLEPAVAALFGWALLHETLLPSQWVAVALVVLASAGGAWTMRPAPTAPAEPPADMPPTLTPAVPRPESA